MFVSCDDFMGFFDEFEIVVIMVDYDLVFIVVEFGDLYDKIFGGYFKNLFVKDKKGWLFLIIMFYDVEIDLKKVYQIIGV